MKRFFLWVGIVVAGLVGLLLMAYAIAYLASERVLNRIYPIPASSISIPTDTALVAEGGRLAAIRGCVGACHGKQAEGRVMFDKPAIARITAPNLTESFRKSTDAQLVAAIRSGVRSDGRGMLVMPSESLVSLTDDDLGKIIAYMKTLPAATGPSADVTVGPVGRVGLVTGKFRLVTDIIATTTPPPEATGEEMKIGRYLAQTTCGGCHGPDLRGTSNPSFTSPDLAVTASYSAESFTTLMRTGVASGGRTLGYMSEYARDHLKHLTDAEIAAVYSYLRVLPPAVNRKSS